MTDAHRILIDSLFRRYARGVGSYVLTRVGDREIAESITSSVFLIVVRNIAQCRSPSAAAWLWSIVRSELARHFRSARPAAELLTDTLIGPELDPAQSAEQAEMQQRMRLALEKLSDEQQRLIYMKFFQDMGNTEIAAALHLSASNVGVIVHRATRRLRELMEAGTDAASPLRRGGNR